MEPRLNRPCQIVKSGWKLRLADAQLERDIRPQASGLTLAHKSYLSYNSAQLSVDTWPPVAR